MRILILGHYKLERLLGPLVARGATEFVLWSDINPGPGLQSTPLRWIPMNQRASPEHMLHLLESVRPDATIANVFGESEEHLILTYALAAKQLDSNQQLLWHSPLFAELSIDKASFHSAAKLLGLPVPDGEIAEKPGDVRLIARGLGGPPVILKEARAQARKGVYAAPNSGSLESLLSSGGLRFPLVVQKMVRGEEIGVEVISAHGQSCRFPVVSTGDMDFQCDPVARVRSAPRALPQSTMRMVRWILDTLEDQLRPQGPWQLDMALVGREVMVLEMNGRLGGLADMGLGATGFDSHELFCDLVMGTPLPTPVPVAAAMEIPVVPGMALPPANDRVLVSVESSSLTNPGLTSYDYLRLSIRSADRAAVGRWADQLDPAAIRAPLSALRTQVNRAFEGLESAGVPVQ